MENLWKLFGRGLAGGIVLAAVFAGFAGFLCLLYRLVKFMRPKSVRQEEQRILSHRFYRLSGRARAAYLILCLEEALRFYQLDVTAWEWILRELWTITANSEDGWIDNWLHSAGELLPSMVLTNKTVPEEPGTAQFLYTQAGSAMIVINAILEGVYTMVCEWSPNTAAHDPDALELIDKAEETMRAFGVPLPAYEIVQRLSEQKDSSFGRAFDGLRLSCLPAAQS